MYRAVRRWGLWLLGVALVGACAAAVLVYEHYTDPQTLRTWIAAEFSRKHPEAVLTLDGVEGSLFGSLTLHDVRVRLPDDPPGGAPFAHFSRLTVVPGREWLRNGPLRIERIVADSPTLHLRERPDGTWNVADLVGVDPLEVDSDTAVEIRSATVAVHFGRAGRPAAWLRDVQLAILLTPPAVAQWQARLDVLPLGPTEVVGSLDLTDGALAADVRIAELPLSVARDALLDHLPAGQGRVARDFLGQAAGLHGLVGGTLHVRHTLGTTDPPQVTAEGALREVRLRHPGLPYPVAGGAVSFWSDGERTTLTGLDCAVGPMRLRADAEVLRGDGGPPALAADVRLTGVPFAPPLHDLLTDKLKQLWEKLAPEGAADFAGRVVVAEGWPTVTGAITPRDASVTWYAFPYRLEHVGGTIELAADQEVRFDCTARAGPAPVTCRGLVRPSEPWVEIDLDLTATGVPIDAALVAAMPPAARPVLDRFAVAGGRGSLRARASRPPGADGTDLTVVANVSAAQVNTAWFDYPVDDVAGQIAFEGLQNDPAPDRLVYTGFRARSGRTRLTLSGASVLRDAETGAGGRTRLDLAATDLPIDDRLRHALPPGPVAALDHLHLQGVADGSYRLTLQDGREPEHWLRVDPHGATMRPASFPYLLHDLVGHVTVHDRRLWFEGLAARHGPTRLTASGTHSLGDDAGELVLTDVTVHDLAIDGPLLAAAPPGLRSTLEFVKPQRPVDVQLRRFALRYPLGDDPLAEQAGGATDGDCEGAVAFRDTALVPDVGIADASGRADLKLSWEPAGVRLDGNLRLDTAELLGFRATGMQAPIKLRGDRLQLSLGGDFHGGNLGGWLHSDLASGQWQCNLLATQADLSRYLASRDAAVEGVDGTVDAQLYLLGGPHRNLSGAGSVRVKDARLVRLPVVMSALQALALKEPDGEVFDEVQFDFAVEPQALRIDRIDLLGDSISLVSIPNRPGRLDLATGALDVRLHTRTSRDRLEIPLITDGLRFASNQTMSLRLTGPPSGLTVTPEPMPGLQDALRQALRLDPRRTR